MEIPSRSRLAIPDLRSGMAFLSRLPLSNPSVAHPTLAEFLESLIESPPPFQVFVQLLEQTRAPLAALQAEVSKGFLGRAIPLSETEENLFQQVVRAWQRMGRAYARCAQLDQGKDPEHADRVATILQRCIRYAGLSIIEHFRVRRDLPNGMWLDFYGYYDSAEEWSIANRPVFEPEEKARQSSYCTAELVVVLLVELAGPYSYSVRDIGLIVQWARLWAPLVSVQAAVSHEVHPQYLIDLQKDVGIRLARHATPAASARRLDTASLSAQISQVRSQLEEKVAPSRLGLGDCQTTHAKQLLSSLARPWTQIAAPRRFHRRAAQGEAPLASGFENIYYLVAGRDFEGPEAGSVYSRKEFELLYAFRHRVDPTSQLFLEKPERDVPADTWQILNQSANGFRLERRMPGQRVAHKQLLAIRPPDSDRFLLAQAHWLMQEYDVGLVAGIEMLPGTPEAIAVRRMTVPETGSGEAVAAGAFSIGFMLPEIASMRTPSSLILPSDWYRFGQLVEMYTTTTWRVRLTGLLQRGPDFDRVSFVMAG